MQAPVSVIPHQLLHAFNLDADCVRRAHTMLNRRSSIGVIETITF